VTPDEAAAPALKKARRVVETPDGKEQGVVELHACQEGENDYAEVVVVYEPEGTSLMMGGLHPRVCSRAQLTVPSPITNQRVPASTLQTSCSRQSAIRCAHDGHHATSWHRYVERVASAFPLRFPFAAELQLHRVCICSAGIDQHASCVQASLFEKPVNAASAKASHTEFR